MSHPWIPDSVLLQLRHYGFNTHEINVSNGVRNNWDPRNPHHVVKASMKLYTSSQNIEAISRTGQAVAPRDSLSWYLQTTLLGHRPSRPPILDIGSDSVVAEGFSIRHDSNDPDLYHIDLTLHIIQPIVLPEESLTHKHIKPVDFDLGETSISNPTKIKPIKLKIRRPKKWV